jgi:hypothetical protein
VRGIDVSEIDGIAEDEPAPRRVLPLPVNVASIIGLFLGALGLFNAIRSLTLIGDEQYLEDNDVTAGAVASFGVIGLVISAAQLVAAVFVRRAHRGARVTLLVLAGLGLVFGLLIGNPISLVLNGAIVYCLIFPASTKAFFAGPAAADA